MNIIRRIRTTMSKPRSWLVAAVVLVAIAALVGQLTAVNVVLERGDRLARQDRVNDQLRAEVASLQQSLQCVAGKTAAYDVALGQSVAAFEQELVNATQHAPVDYERLAATAEALEAEVAKRAQTAQANPPSESAPAGATTLCTGASPATSAPHG